MLHRNIAVKRVGRAEVRSSKRKAHRAGGLVGSGQPIWPDRSSGFVGSGIRVVRNWLLIQAIVDEESVEHAGGVARLEQAVPDAHHGFSIGEAVGKPYAWPPSARETWD